VPFKLRLKKKNFGRSKDATFSPTQFKKLAADSQKENLTVSLNNISTNSNSNTKFGKPSPRANGVKEPLQSVENSLISPSRKSRPGSCNLSSRTRQPLKPVFTKKVVLPEKESSLNGAEMPLMRDLQILETPVPIQISPPSVIITDEAPLETLQTPISSPIIKTSLSRSLPKMVPVPSTTEISPNSKGILDSRLSPKALTPFKSPSSAIKSSPKTSSPKSPNRPISPLDEQRLLQRQKQIDYGYRTVGYLRYRLLVSKDQRKPDHPRTPKKTQGCSKRSWDGQLKKWRRDLHLWDPDNIDAFRALLNSDLVVSIIAANPELDDIVKIVREKMDNPTANLNADDELFSPQPTPIVESTSASASSINPDGVNEKKSVTIQNH